MSADAKQYREKLGRTNYEAMLQRADLPENEVQWDDEAEFFRDGMGHPAEAVAAQVLRDLLTELYGPDAFSSKTHGMITIRLVQNFAAERGINMEDPCHDKPKEN